MRAEHGSLQSAKSRDVLHCYHSVIGQRVLSVIGSQFVAAAGRFLMVSPTSSVRWSSGRRSREEDEERESPFVSPTPASANLVRSSLILRQRDTQGGTVFHLPSTPAPGPLRRQSAAAFQPFAAFSLLFTLPEAPVRQPVNSLFQQLVVLLFPVKKK